MKDNMLTETQKVNAAERAAKVEVRETLLKVYAALQEKGYNPLNQIVGYILSGDPTYITGHMNARGIITKIERDELLEEVFWFYLRDKA